MEQDLSREFLKVVEEAAIGAAKTMGTGDRKFSDQAAGGSRRAIMETIPMNGTIVIGEGERGEAPMLFIGEKVGKKTDSGNNVHEVDIGVDPWRRPTSAQWVRRERLQCWPVRRRVDCSHAPDCYMEKIIVGPSSKGAVNLDAPVKDNLRAIAKRFDRDVENLVIIVLDRPRHAQLIQQVREAGARIRLIGDVDLSAGISVAFQGTGVHAVMGIGGAPEGVLTAAALRCLNGEIQARLVVKDDKQVERMQQMGIKDVKRVYSTQDLAPAKNIVFAATGVTDGSLLKGVRLFGDGYAPTRS